MTSSGNPLLRIADLRVDPTLDEICKDGVILKLEPRAMRLFVCLAERAGQVVSVDELLDRVWKDVVVSPDSVYAAVASLRRILGDDPKQPKYIANVMRRGYRLVAPVSAWIAPVGAPVQDAPQALDDGSSRLKARDECGAPAKLQVGEPTGPPGAILAGDGADSNTTVVAPVSGWSRRSLLLIAAAVVVAAGFSADRLLTSRRLPDFMRAPSSTVQTVSGPELAIPEKSIAVLPFVDMSEKHDQQYFSDGLAEELSDLLAQVPDLRVPGRTSSFSFRGKSDDIPTIAQKLRVAHVLEGSVRKSGNTVRVTVQLIRVDTGYHIWSKTFDRDLKDIFEVQDDVAAAVVGALKARLTPGGQELRLSSKPQDSGLHRTSNIEAYIEFLLGRELSDRGDFNSYQRAVDAYRRAIRLDPGFAAAYAEMAVSQFWVADHTGNLSGLQQALTAADKAVVLAPDEAAGYAARGFMRDSFSWDWSGAQADFVKALTLEPTDSRVQAEYGDLLVCLGRLTEAITAMKKAIELDPLSNSAWSALGYDLTQDGQFAAAHEALHRALEIQPEDDRNLYHLGELQLLESRAAEALVTFRQLRDEGLRVTGIAIAEHALGHAKESQQALDELTTKRARDYAFQIAEVQAWRGENGQAFDWLERAYTQRDGGLPLIKIDLLLRSLRGDPRFAAMLSKLKLPA